MGAMPMPSPLIEIFQRAQRMTWTQRYTWWPRQTESGKRIWLTKAWYGTRLVYGPAGEDPVRLEQWMTDEEYMWYRLTEQ